MSKTTVLVDGNAIAYTISINDCKNEKDFVKQYFSRLREYSKQFTSMPKFILFFDNKKGGTWRDEIFPDYQKQRKLQHNVNEKQLNEIKLRSKYLSFLRNIIDTSNKFTYISYPNTETDDLVSLYCSNIQEKGETVVILTTDKDLFQLICDKGDKKVQVLFLVKRKLIKDASLGRDALEKKLWLGDNSDSIPGVCKNVGEKSIEDFKIFLHNAKEKGININDVVESKKLSELLNIKYVPSFSNYNEEQYNLNKKLIDLSYVVELDKKENNIKTNYIKENLNKAKVSPYALYGLI